MKRYWIYIGESGADKAYNELVQETNDGEWVKYSEVEAELAKEREISRKYNEMLGEATVRETNLTAEIAKKEDENKKLYLDNCTLTGWCKEKDEEIARLKDILNEAGIDIEELPEGIRWRKR